MVLLAVFVALSAFAIAKAEGNWKLWNLFIIAGGCGLGFLVSYLAGMWAKNMGLGGEIAIPTSLAFGALAAVFAPRKKDAAKIHAGP